MYNYIIGKDAYAAGNTIVIDNNGIGYEIGVSGNTLYDCAQIGSVIKIYTYLYVKEDVMALYGFSRLEEKNLFMRLIEISGVGPKLAMQILSGTDLKTLTVAIATSDIKTLSKIKGLGKKTAELIVVSLRDQITIDMLAIDGPQNGGNDKDEQDAVYALVALGISNTEAVKIVSDVAKKVSGTENIIREALSRIGSK